MRTTILLLAALTACSSLPTVSLPGGAARQHVVLFWLRPETPAEVRAALPGAIVDAAQQARGVEAVWIGTPAGTPRTVVDNSYDLQVVMRFADAAALTAWEPDPAHQALLQRFGPHVARVLVYDAQ